MSSRARYATAAVTHEEVRALVPAYAAGALDEFASDAVRAHLATGCTVCLADVYARPVGLPRSDNASHPIVVPAPRPRFRPGLGTAVVALALALAAAVAWIVAELRGREAESRAETARTAERLTDVVASRANLTARLEALEREVAASAEAASRATAALRAAGDESARLRDEIAAAGARVDALRARVRRRDDEIARLRLGGVGRSGEVLAAPGAELLPLHALAPFRDGRGHVLWSAAGDGGVAYLFGLPRASYRVRVLLDDGREVSGTPFGVDGDGTAVVPVPTDTSHVHPRAVEVVLDPAGRRVLGWDR
jgi:putative zinc finger protein